MTKKKKAGIKKALNKFDKMLNDTKSIEVLKVSVLIHFYLTLVHVVVFQKHMRSKKSLYRKYSVVSVRSH